MTLVKPRKLGIVLLLTVSLLSGCATSSHVSNSFCEIYIPVLSSPQDTEATKLGIDSNNSVWLRICQ